MNTEMIETINEILTKFEIVFKSMLENRKPSIMINNIEGQNVLGVFAIFSIRDDKNILNQFLFPIECIDTSDIEKSLWNMWIERIGVNVQL